MNVFDLVATLRLDSTQYENELEGAKGTAERGGSGISNALSTASKVAAGALAAAGTAAVAFAKSSVDAGMTFDKSMSQVAATMGYTVDEINTEGSEAAITFQTLNEFAKEMGRTTAFSASESAEALNYMALAGYDAETSMEMLPTVLDLAAAGSMGLASASDMVTDAQSALGLKLDETKQMVNQMAVASSKSNTSVEQLGEAILTIGATARSVRGGTSELATVLGVLADNGIKGSEGGTHLRNIILSLQSPTDKAAVAMKQLGIEVYDADGNMNSIVDIIGQVQRATEGMDGASRDAVLNGIFNKTDLAAVNALLGTSEERFDELEQAIKGAWYTAGSLDDSLKELNSSITFDDLTHAFEDIGVSVDDVNAALDLSKGDAKEFLDYIWEWSDAGTSYEEVCEALGIDVNELQEAFDGATGAAKEMANTQLDNLAGDVTLWKSALEGAQIAISDHLSPVLRTFVQTGTEGITELTTAFTQGGLTDVLDTISGWVNEKAPLIGIAFDSVREVVSTAFTAIKEVWNDVLQPALKDFHDFVSNTLAPIIRDTIDTVIKPAFERASEAVKIAWENVIKPAFEALRDFVMNTLAPAITKAWEETIKPAVETVAKVIDTVWTTIIKPAWEAMTKLVKDVLGKDVKDTWESTIKPAIETVSSAISAAWTGTIKPAWDAMSKLVTDTLAPAIKDAWENLIQPTIEGVANIIQSVWEGIIKPAWDSMSKLVSETLAPKIKEAWETTIKPAIETVGKIISEVWEGTIRPAWENMNSKMDEVASAVKNAWETIIQPAINTVSEVISTAWTNVIKPAWDALSEAVGVVGSTISDVWNNVISPVVSTVGGVIAGVWTETIKPAWEGLLGSLGIISQSFNEFLGVVTDIWGQIRDAIVSPVQTAEAWLGEIVDRLKGLFNFEWSLPKMKMPHFTVEWVDIAGILSLPSITVEWYRKAYDNPYMFTSPTVMGFGDGGSGEMVYGHESLMNDIKAAMKDVVGTVQSDDKPIVVQVMLDKRIIAQAVTGEQNRQRRAYA